MIEKHAADHPHARLENGIEPHIGEAMDARVSRKGFTLLEVMITAAIFSALSVIFLTMMSSALAVSEREGTLNRMDREANQALQVISNTFRRAVIPVITDTSLGASYPSFVHDPGEVDENGMPPQRSFQALLNSNDGFGQHGRSWFNIMAAGTDFVPFTVPVDFGGDGDTVDSNFLPELGIILPGGAHVPAADYVLTPAASPVPALNELRGRPMHPYMQELSPDDFGITSATPISITGGRFRKVHATSPGDRFSFPADRDQAYAVLRFVPADDESGNPIILEEQALLGGDGYDLNDNGTLLDTFALGSLQLIYATPAGNTPVATPVIGPMVLMQLNTDGVGYKPLFRLVAFSSASSPIDLVYDGTTPLTNPGFAIFVNLLVLDWSPQRSPLAFGSRSSTPFIVRHYETLVELRNQSLP